MPVLFLVIVFIVWKCYKFYDALTTPSRGFTIEEIRSMRDDTIGKSQKEIKEIYKQYKKKIM